MESSLVAQEFKPIIGSIMKANPNISVKFWDGSVLGDEKAPITITIKNPNVLRRLLYAPGELGLARSYVAGDIELEGKIYPLISNYLGATPTPGESSLKIDAKGWAAIVKAALKYKAIGPPLPSPPEEIKIKGIKHSKPRDRTAISHHYDLPESFYRLFLGETLTYSCARFTSPTTSLDDAQKAKYDLICRKLGLKEGMRLLDVGCGWGGMVLHAAQNYGVEALGVTLSEEQAKVAQRRVEEAGLSSRVTIKLQDYRDINEQPFDSISSIGMFEHVGLDKLKAYFEVLSSLLKPRGRLLNHGISRPPGPHIPNSRSFIDRYVFPDGELVEVGNVISVAQQCGFEVRDVESLREHYGMTLRHWVQNLEDNWEEAVSIVGPGRAKVWRIYMAGSAINFENGLTSIHQVLAVKPEKGPNGSISGMPLTREELFQGGILEVK